MITAGNLACHSGMMKLYRDGQEVSLSTKEHAMLHLFMESQGKVFTKQQLYQQIWGETIVDENAGMVYISRLRNKIGRDPKNPVYIKTGWGVGYKFSECR